MKRLIQQATIIYPAKARFDLSLVVFRIIVSAELMIAHGFKKIGVGVAEAENVPNPLHLPDLLNQYFAIAANLFFPVLVMLGLLTRLSVLPILAVTLTGYFIVHWNDSLLEKDMPLMYSIVYLFLLFIGPGKYSVDYIIHERLK